MVNSHDHQDIEKRQKVNFNGTETRDGKALLNYLDEDFDAESESFDTRCLQDLLEESQSDSNTDTEETSGSEVTSIKFVAFVLCWHLFTSTYFRIRPKFTI